MRYKLGELLSLYSTLVTPIFISEILDSSLIYQGVGDVLGFRSHPHPSLMLILSPPCQEQVIPGTFHEDHCQKTVTVAKRKVNLIDFAFIKIA